MKKNKKLNSIATMSKKELQDVNGGSIFYAQVPNWDPDVFPLGIPNPIWNQGVREMNAGMMNQVVMNQVMIR